MSALCDKDIFKLLKSRDLIIHPLMQKSQIKGARIDLRLDNIFYIIRRFKKPCYDPMDYIAKVNVPESYGEILEIPFGNPYYLHPGDYVLAPLFEFVCIPSNIIGRLDGRSSLGRLGVVVHSTAGSVDPGYEGPLIIELMNNGMFPVALYPLMRVATLILHKMTDDAKYPYEGKYGSLQDFPGAESKLYEDEDMKVIHRMRTSV
jgi:dCTP deaminase